MLLLQLSATTVSYARADSTAFATYSMFFCCCCSFQIAIFKCHTSVEKIVANSLHIYSYIQGPPNTFFFVKCLKETTEYFLKFLFYLKVQSFPFIMENNFIQMAESAGHAVAYTNCPIFKHIIDCMQLYFINGFTHIVL